MKKIIFLLATTMICLGLSGFISNAEEDNVPSLAESILQKEKQRSNLPSFDMSSQLISTEKKILTYFNNITDVNSINYIDLLEKISTSNELLLDRTEEEQAEFSEFSMIYYARISPFIYPNMNTDELAYVESLREELLSKSYQDIKNENIQSILSSDVSNQPKPRGLSGGTFNIKSATNYAKKHAFNNNTNYRYFNAGDCTNFASQIVKAAGKQMSYYKNNSGAYWYYTNSVAYGDAWPLAHKFATYWSADYNVTYSCSTKAQVNSKAIEGDFIAYMSKGTYQINHISYVSSKKNGVAHVTQHSVPRSDYSFNTSDTSAYASFIVLRIR